MLARYRAEVTDSLIRREQEADLHGVLGEVALAERNPKEALVEFRRADVGYDGRPANECAPCLPFNLARAWDAAGQADSAVVLFERYLSTPYWLKMSPELDPMRVPAIHERLGQLYEAKGNPGTGPPSITGGSSNSGRTPIPSSSPASPQRVSG
jgi:hypothetical protein